MTIYFVISITILIYVKKGYSTTEKEKSIMHMVEALYKCSNIVAMYYRSFVVFKCTYSQLLFAVVV